MVTRAMNDLELLLARSQASAIMHNLLHELAAFVTSSLSGATGEENATMAAAPEEHRRMIIAVRTQADYYPKAQYRRCMLADLQQRSPRGICEGSRRRMSRWGLDYNRDNNRNMGRSHRQ